MNLSLPDNWRVFDDAESLAQQLVAEILQLAESAIQKTGRFILLQREAVLPTAVINYWQSVKPIGKTGTSIWGDERVLPFSHPERNSQALLSHWLNNNEIPAKNIHFINTEAGAVKSAKAYASIIASVAQFDLCLLGMGEDGHTASLFPGHDNGSSVQEVFAESASEQTPPIIIENDSPKQPSQRVSLSYAALNRCDLVIKLVTGEGKRNAVNLWLTDKTELPIKKAQGQQTKVYLSQDALPI